MNKVIQLSLIFTTLGMLLISGCTEIETTNDNDITIHSFSVTPSNIKRNTTVNLTWNVSNAESISIHPGVGQVNLTGFILLQPEETTTYTLIAIKGLLNKTSTTIVTVDQPKNNTDSETNDTSDTNNNSTDNETNGKLENDSEVTESTFAIINTSKGIIKVELYKNLAPITCKNFIKLANEGFYDGMIFHRIMDDFMIQAGNTYPNGTIKNSPYGNIEFESSDNLKHEDGSISMASTGWGVGGSAQFFICDGAQPSLDGGYAVFGKTVEGIGVVRDIADDPQDNSNPAGGGRPITDIIIYSITIET